MAEHKVFVVRNRYDKKYYLIMDKESWLSKVEKFLCRTKIGIRIWTFMVFVILTFAKATGTYRTGFSY